MRLDRGLRPVTGCVRMMGCTAPAMSRMAPLAGATVPVAARIEALIALEKAGLIETRLGV